MVTKKQEELLRHTLGADSRYMKKEWGFRNVFVASEGNDDFETLKDMEKHGFFKSGERFTNTVFWATKKGALAIGFKPYQLRKTDLAS